MAAMAVMTISCNKNNPGGGDEPTQLANPEYRITTLYQGWKDGAQKNSADSYIYTWNTDGTIAKVDLAWNTEIYSSYVFTWSGNTVTVTDAKKDNAPVCTITVNDKKSAIKIEQAANSEVGKDWKKLEMKYDDNNFLTLVKKDDDVITVQVIDEDGNIDWWGRIGVAENISESTTATGWRKKIHTYYGTVNNGGVHGEWNEDSKVKRWFYETGLMGRASVNIMRTAWWYGIVDGDVVKPEYAEKLAYYPLDVDANNCIKQELKLYDKKEKYEADPATMAVDYRVAFEFEKIK